MKVKPCAKEERLVTQDDVHFEISVKEPPRKGMANHAILRLLARYFGASISHIEIISGHTARQKVIAVNEPRHD